MEVMNFDDNDRFLCDSVGTGNGINVQEECWRHQECNSSTCSIVPGTVPGTSTYDIL